MPEVPDWIESIIRETTCEYCGAEIVYAKTRKGVGVFNKNSWTPHRLSCPFSSHWSKKKKEKEMKQTTLEDWAIRHDNK